VAGLVALELGQGGRLLLRCGVDDREPVRRVVRLDGLVVVNSILGSTQRYSTSTARLNRISMVAKTSTTPMIRNRSLFCTALTKCWPMPGTVKTRSTTNEPVIASAHAGAEEAEHGQERVLEGVLAEHARSAETPLARAVRM
jgi:hypothetical protein